MPRQKRTSLSRLLLLSAGLISSAPGLAWAEETAASSNTGDTTAPAPVFLTRSPLADLRPAAPGPNGQDPLPSAQSTQVASATQLPSLPPVTLDATAVQTPQVPGPGVASVPDPGSITTASTAASAPPATPQEASGSAWKASYIDLLNLLVARGVINKGDSTVLITKAEKAAAASVASQASAQGGVVTAGGGASAAASDDDTMRVTYVPDTVKEQIRNEVKEDVMQQARNEGWAAPNAVPELVTRYHVSADLRFRYEGDFFPDGNDNLGDFHNFNAINTGAPFDNGVNSLAPNPPTYNVDQDRNRFRMRARFGAGVDLTQGFSAALRIGTGQDNNPVTENQTLGLANNAQGGNFSKYAIWLDRGFLRYQLGDSPDQNFIATIGRMDNPFMGTTMLWASDLGFDGLAVQGRYKVTDGITPFFTAGWFPVFNTDLNFSTTSAAKFSSEDKYLFAVQGGTDWGIAKDITLKTAAALYYFENVEGKVSDPFTPLFSSDGGNTDDSRPSFAQNGNTYIALRDIIPDATNNFGTTNQWQYYGLATPFHEVAIDAQMDFSQFDPFHISLSGEFVKNIAFDRSAIEANGSPQTPGPVNNLSNDGSFVGGDIGYNVKLTLGSPVLAKLGDWNINLTYRYLESDATIDAFTDSDFGGPLTGTNLKGYIIGGNVALTSRVWASLQWMSADSIAGPTYKNDLIQVDLNAKF